MSVPLEHTMKNYSGGFLFSSFLFFSLFFFFPFSFVVLRELTSLKSRGLRTGFQATPISTASLN